MKVIAIDHAELLVSDGQRQHRVWVAESNGRRWAFCEGDVWELETAAPAVRRARSSGHEVLAAPMPATVIDVPVAVGERVSKGQTVLVLEAMKMELPLRAAHDGAITAINCAPGELVQPGATLMEIE
jgi:biotin carboxyl carrier protein